MEDPEGAARALAHHGTTAIVTIGSEGAAAASGDEVIRVPAPSVDAVDATGTGDLFVAAYVGSDLRGASLEDRLRWATLYAALSVREPTAFDGALRLEPFLGEGAARGLSPP